MTSLLTDPDNGGAFGASLRWAFGRSWRTTIAAWGALAATMISAVAAMQDAPHPIVKWAPIAAQFLVSMGLMVTKDARVHGYDRPEQNTEHDPKLDSPPLALAPSTTSNAAKQDAADAAPPKGP